LGVPLFTSRLHASMHRSPALTMLWTYDSPKRTWGCAKRKGEWALGRPDSVHQDPQPLGPHAVGSLVSLPLLTFQAGPGTEALKHWLLPGESAALLKRLLVHLHLICL
jgi:hypothetical protein